jgi:tetraacyldisaccharide 4'-kinase
VEGDFIKVNKWLMPLSWAYGLGVRFRNLLFEMGVLKSRAFSVPVISVGNITVGGTGKTPHVEYLIQLLLKDCKVAVLSRGYKRRSHGFVLADKTATARSIGDEPYQMKLKFPKAMVAVDKKRVHGINQLLLHDGTIDAILLDDAFQHRYVKPGINILLVDYHRLIIYDKLLPAGRLREPLKGKDRADIVIITKCPRELKPVEFRMLTKAMDLYPYQSLYFTTFVYDNLRGVFTGKRCPLSSIGSTEHILLLTGIASPQQLIEDLTPLTSHLSPLIFPDHHSFRSKDIRRINDTFAAMNSPKRIITTEKDAARLTATEGLSDEVRQNIYALPVRVSFMLDQQSTFNENIIGYVRKNSRNSILAKAEDDNKPRDSHRSGNRSRTISFRNN